MPRGTPKSPRFIIADFETDPFQYRTKPEVFLSGVCDGEKTIQWWEPGTDSFCEYLRQQKEKTYVFFHNGGKFDFFYLPWPLLDPIKIINGRIVSAGFGPKCTLRDSFAILPFALAEYKKTEIDYNKFTKENREQNKIEILAYHRDDLRDTFTLVKAFIDRFGLRLTAPSAAIRELNKLCPTEKQGESHDEKFRPYYFGGRVECFERGDIRGRWKLFDVNSMYPGVMSDRNHPTGAEYEFTCDLQRLVTDIRPGFATVHGRANGCFPRKTEKGRLEFPHETATFRITLWELREALSLGLFEPHECTEGYIAKDSQNFEPFVSVFAREKRDAKINGDRISELFAKLIMNSSYGKFGANPENYFDYRFLLADAPFPQGWDIYEDWGWLIIICRPSIIRAESYRDVATAASITGAARARLMRALATAGRPIYCDTDSIICESIAEPVGTGLGEWKLECEADRATIIGKKLYALSQNGECVKKASKGVKMTLKDYFDVANGKAYTYEKSAPTFKKDGSATFINRVIKGVTYG